MGGVGEIRPIAHLIGVQRERFRVPVLVHGIVKIVLLQPFMRERLALFEEEIKRQKTDQNYNNHDDCGYNGDQHASASVFLRDGFIQRFDNELVAFDTLEPIRAPTEWQTVADVTSGAIFTVVGTNSQGFASGASPRRRALTDGVDVWGQNLTYSAISAKTCALVQVTNVNLKNIFLRYS